MTVNTIPSIPPFENTHIVQRIMNFSLGVKLKDLIHVNDRIGEEARRKLLLIKDRLEAENSPFFNRFIEVEDSEAEQSKAVLSILKLQGVLASVDTGTPWTNSNKTEGFIEKRDAIFRHFLEEAKKSIELIGNYLYKAQALIELYEIAPTPENFKAVSQSIESIDDSDYRALALCDLSMAKIRLKIFDGARESIELIQNVHLKEVYLYKLALVQVEAMRLDEAKESIELIEVLTNKTDALIKLYKINPTDENFKAAFQSIKFILRQEDKDKALCDLAKAQAESKSLDEARKTIALIQSSFQKARALIKLYEIVSTPENFKAAKESIDLVKKNYSNNDLIFLDLVIAQAKVGNLDEARKSVDSIQKSHLKAEALIEISKMVGTSQHINTIGEASELIRNSYIKDRYLVDLIEKLHTEARKFIELIENKSSKEEALSHLACVQAERGRLQDAKKIIDEVNYPQTNIWALFEIAKQLK